MSEAYLWPNYEAAKRIDKVLALGGTGREQDWEIELADPSRVAEMLDALETLSLDLEERSALALVTTHSMEQACLEGGLSLEYFDRMRKILGEDEHLKSRMRSYWIDNDMSGRAEWAQKFIG